MENILYQEFRNTFEKELLEEISSIGKYVRVSQGEIIIDNDKYIKFIPLLLSGSIKIIRVNDDGSEILLYYVKASETCAMSLTCCLAHQKSRIRAIAEEPTDMIILPVQKMEEWMNKYSSWKNFVMLTYSSRFDELLKTIDGIAFHKVDERLVAYLKNKAKMSDTTALLVSHQQIAEELNSSREVISRLLKQLENNGKIKLGRNKIELLEI